MTLTRDAVQGSVTQDHWSGILEFRATGSSVRELAKAPQDALFAFCSSDELQIASDASASDAHEKIERTTETPSAAVAGSVNAFSTHGAGMGFPGVDFTVPSGRVSSTKWPATTVASLSPFDQPFEFNGGDQLRAAAATTPVDDPWM